ncbi:MAG TPA: choice-of-anchor D domain-containing protein [Myxococcota bacterium]|nr:choice-of-anchor D domain-containing protein [Myxococcota bacterium]HQP94852.1 choice-of-anchor D domain-containing protein [Myxococcota bacterium]
MKFARFLILVAVLTMPFAGSSGCSCNEGPTAKDLVFAHDPLSLDFGSVPLHSSRTLTLDVWHEGSDGEVIIDGIALQGISADEFEFDVINDFADEWDTYGTITLGVGVHAQITLKYSPANAGSDNGNIVVSHNVATQDRATEIPVTTSGQMGDLTADPYPIDFGEVEAGEFADLSVEITNNGTFTVDVQDVYLDYEGSFDFSKIDVTSKDGATAVTQLAPGESLNVTLRYEPRDGECDDSYLIVLGNVEATAKQWAFDVTGCELGPKISILPPQIDFGFVEVDQAATKQLTVTNNGNINLQVSNIGTSMGSHPDIKILNGPAAGTPDIIEPGEFKVYDVQWTATQQAAFLDGNLGAVTVTSNDATSSPNVIPVYGQVEAPAIEVLPQLIDFGFGAQMTPKSATVTIKNNGYGDLNITNLEIINPSTTQYGTEFTIEFNKNFPITSPTNPVASTIDGNSFIGIDLTFTNRGPDNNEEVTATLVIESNSKGQERLEIPMKAKRAGAAVCRAQLVPAITDFGVVAIGWTYSKEARLINTGTGDCLVTQYKLADCTSSMMGSTCPAALTGTNSKYFKFATPPPMAPAVLQAGRIAKMFIDFTPPTVTDIFNLLSRSSALMSFKIKDVKTGAETVIPDCGGAACSYNVTGQSGIAKAAVLPDHIDYGVVTIGCFSKTYSICIYNSGNAPLKINDIQMKGCTPEFHLKNVPALPKTVGTGAPVCFETNYSPADEGLDRCSIHMSVTDQSAPVIAIPLKGEGTYETQHTDEFIQIKGDEVDILFVIDDSGSMCEEQDRLASSFGEFIAQASVWDNDYHIGVISVNVVDEAIIGRLNRGSTSVTPRFITKSGNAQSQFANLVNLGCDGNSDAQEAGLQAAQTGLAAPLTTDTEITCSRTTDCTADANICADPSNCPYTCIDGTCGGFNKGFMREDAQLEIIILSDEEDQSSAAISFYVDFLTNIKGWANVGRMHVNSIVGVKGVPAGTGSECTATDGGTAAHGYRYIQASEDTGGKYGSICESNFEPIMSDIADITFNPKLQFFLSRLADPATVKVSVDKQGDGQFVPCNDGWEFDAPSNSVIFDAEGGCVPQPQDHIKVSYKMLCLKG